MAYIFNLIINSERKTRLKEIELIRDDFRGEYLAYLFRFRDGSYRLNILKDLA